MLPLLIYGRILFLHQSEGFCTVVTLNLCLETRLKCWWSPYTHIQRSCSVVCYSKHGNSGCAHPPVVHSPVRARYIHLVVDFWYTATTTNRCLETRLKCWWSPYTHVQKSCISLLLKTRRQRLHPPALFVLLWGRYIHLVVNFWCNDKNNLKLSKPSWKQNSYQVYFWIFQTI